MTDANGMVWLTGDGGTTLCASVLGVDLRVLGEVCDAVRHEACVLALFVKTDRGETILDHFHFEGFDKLRMTST